MFNRSKKTKIDNTTVLLIGYNPEVEEHKRIKEILDNAQFKTITDKIYSECIDIYDKEELIQIMQKYQFDFWYVLDSSNMSDISNIVYGYYVGSGIGCCLEDGFIDDISKMQEERNNV